MSILERQNIFGNEDLFASQGPGGYVGKGGDDTRIHPGANKILEDQKRAHDSSFSVGKAGMGNWFHDNWNPNKSYNEASELNNLGRLVQGNSAFKDPSNSSADSKGHRDLRGYIDAAAQMPASVKKINQESFETKTLNTSK